MAEQMNAQLTFAGSEPKPLPGKPMTAVAVQPQGGQVGQARGNPIAQNLSAGPVDIPTMMGGFLDLASKVIEPKLKEMRQKAMYEGMQAYVAGAKIEDMRKEQNPIMTAFGGDGAFVRGAVLHQSASAVSTVGQHLNDNMEALAEMSPQQFGEYLQRVTADAYGQLDPAAQALASPQFLELHTQAMSTQVAAHEKFRKQQAVKYTVESVIAAGGVRQSMTSSIAAGTSNAADVEAADTRILELLDSKPASTSTKEWQTITLRSGVGLLEQGNFKGFEVMKRSQAWQGLEQDQRDALEAKAEQAWQKQELTNPAYLSGVLTREGMLANLQQGTTQFETPEQVLSWIQEQNAINDRETGQPAFNNRETAQYIDAFYAGQARAAKAAALGADDELADQLFTRFVATTGSADASMLTTEQMQTRGSRMWQDIMATEDEEERGILADKFVGAIAADGRAVPAVLKQQLGRDLSGIRNGDPITARSLTSLSIAQEVMSRPNGVEAMSNIVGGENALAYKALLDIGIDFNDPTAVEKHSRSMRVAASAQPTQEEVTAMHSQIQSGRSWAPWKDGSLRADKLTDPGSKVLYSVAAPLAARYRKQYPGLSDDEVISAAMADARRGGDVVAGMFVRPNPTSGGLVSPRDAVAERLGRPVQPKVYSAATMSAAHAATKAQADARGWADFNPAKYRAVDSFNVGGGAVQLTFRTFDSWGFDAPDVGDIKVTLTPDMIALHYEQAEQEQLKENASQLRLLDMINPALPLR